MNPRPFVSTGLSVLSINADCCSASPLPNAKFPSVIVHPRFETRINPLPPPARLGSASSPKCFGSIPLMRGRGRSKCWTPSSHAPVGSTVPFTDNSFLSADGHAPSGHNGLNRGNSMTTIFTQVHLNNYDGNGQGDYDRGSAA